MSVSRQFWFWLITCFSAIGLMYLHLTIGQIPVSIQHIFHALQDSNSNDTTLILVREFRIPRLVMAVVAGGGLSLAGMFMQTLFQNPLAGPYVLGINSGASLLVAISLLSGISFFGSDLGIISSALIGALAAGLLMISIAGSVRSAVSMLLIGLMFSSFTSALVSFLEISTQAEKLKAFTLWSMGSLQNTLFSQLPLILILFFTGVILSFFLVKSLNMLVIGESAAAHLGLNIKRTRIFVLLLTALFSGLITAFCGPIAFVGLAIPNVARIVLRTQDHRRLIGANLILGALFMLSCDIFIQAVEMHFHIPVNVLTSLIGAPFVILVLMRKTV